MAIVLPLVPMQDQSTNLCSSHSTISLRQSSCQSDPNSCPSTLCLIDWFVFLVCLRAPSFREILSSLSCRVVCPFLCSCSCFCPYQACLCPCLRLVCLCPCRTCLWFCRPCRTIHSFGCFAIIQFPFNSLSPCGHKCHIMNSFLGTFDLDCPSPTNPSEQAVCFFVRIQRHRSLSQISSILSCQQF